MQAQIVTITDEASGATARILASLGFNCFSWRPALDDGPREMIWAHPEFAGGEERPSGSGVPLLFPFPGRIAGARYNFGGREYALEPGDNFGNAIHGFVLKRAWRVVEQTASRVVGEFHASRDDRTILERWPADFRIRVSYEVRGRELVSDIRYENVGDGPLPCGFGTHTYFRLPLGEGGSAEETIATVPVSRYWDLAEMIPTGQQSAVTPEQMLDGKKPLGGRAFDTTFTGLAHDSTGVVRTELADPRRGRRVLQTFDKVFAQCVVYTPPHREAFCMEPYTCVPNAIKLHSAGVETGLQILQPGQSFATTIRIAVSG
ncbi:MAG TPA: aldose 1-epimerase [Lacipirellulaceae bacterium]|jgi:aldose 1-epimerase